MVGIVGVPMVGGVGVPMVGSVDVPMAGSVGVPIVGVVDVPMVGSVPMVDVSDVPIVGIVEAPSPSVGERGATPGVTTVWVDDNIDAVAPGGADTMGPKSIRLVGLNKADCAWTAHGHAASTAGRIRFMILFIPPPCLSL
jgi:hypothetical protein